MALFYCSIFNPLQNSKFSWIGCSSHCFCCADGSTSFVQVQLERIVRKIDARQTFVILGFYFETWTWDFFFHMICVNVLWRKTLLSSLTRPAIERVEKKEICYWMWWMVSSLSRVLLGSWISFILLMSVQRQMQIRVWWLPLYQSQVPVLPIRRSAIVTPDQP